MAQVFRSGGQRFPRRRSRKSGFRRISPAGSNRPNAVRPLLSPRWMRSRPRSRITRLLERLRKVLQLKSAVTLRSFFRSLRAGDRMKSSGAGGFILAADLAGSGVFADIGAMLEPGPE